MANPPIDRNRRIFLRYVTGLGAGLFLGTPRPGTASTNPKGQGVIADWTPSTHRLPADGSRLIGRNHYVSARAADTLLDIARRFDLGYWDIVLANPGVDIWMPGAGTRVLVPRRFILPDAPQEGIVVNVPEMRLYYYPPASADSTRHVVTHPIGIGRQDWSTPLGRAIVTEKIPNPTWYPPASIRAEHAAKGQTLPAVVPPGPDNPLGGYALILDIPGYLIHGTNRPSGVGMRVSHGCIRLYPEDMASLFRQVPRGTPVHIVNQPYKIAWSDCRLYLEWQPLPHEEDYTAIDLSRHRALLARLRAAVRAEALSAGFLVHRKRLEGALATVTGVPQPASVV